MKSLLFFGLVAVAFSVVAPRSKGQQPTAPQVSEVTEADIQASLAKLSAEDRKLADAQRFCAIMTKNRLGVMGTPLKVMIKGQPVFLCCKGCQGKALANPDATLATVAELVKANAPVAPPK